MSPLQKLCQEALLRGTGGAEADPALAAVLADFRAHCSRSFALVVLRELEARRIAHEQALQRALRQLQVRADEEHGVLLAEIDRLTSGDAIAQLTARVAQLEAELEERDQTVAQCRDRANTLQARLAALENDSWLSGSMSFLKQPSTKVRAASPSSSTRR